MISIHAPREGSDAGGKAAHCGNSQQISIHAPREGSDFLQYVLLLHQAISIHAPREGSDLTAA